jgi:large subunit ribosomal protein L10
MALSRGEKEKLAKEVAEKLKAAKGVAVFSFKKLTVSESAKLRRGLRETGGRVQVIKKRVFRSAAQSIGITADFSTVEGSVAVTWSDQDMISPAKASFDFVKTHEGSKIVAGLLEGEAITREQVENLALLPGKDELRAKLVGTLIAPVRGFAGVLSGTLRGLPAVLQAIADKQGATS